MTKFVDYPADKIAEQKALVDKLKQGPMANTTRVIAWDKWCNSYEYRKREWEWRQKYFANRE